MSQNVIKSFTSYKELWKVPPRNHIIQGEKVINFNVVKEQAQSYYPFELDLMTPEFSTTEDLSREAFLSCIGFYF
jgi:hypothetical protein